MDEKSVAALVLFAATVVLFYLSHPGFGTITLIAGIGAGWARLAEHVPKKAAGA